MLDIAKCHRANSEWGINCVLDLPVATSVSIGINDAKGIGFVAVAVFYSVGG
jgi:hypothetical protein